MSTERKSHVYFFLSFIEYRAAQELAKGRPFVLPRIHPPTLGTVGRIISDGDEFSSIGDPEYNIDETNTQVSREPSLSTTYNATYRTDTTQRPPTDFLPFFEDLERRTGINSGNMPAKLTADILGTLNSLPADLAQQPNTFGDSRDLDEIELVTDMLDDMTKDDEIDDDFIEALNPNLAIPRATSQDEEDSSPGWFAVCCLLLALFVDHSLELILFLILAIYQLVKTGSSIVYLHFLNSFH